MRAPRQLTAKELAAFLAELAEGWSVTRAAEAAGVHRQRLYEARNGDADFAREWDAAFERGTDLLRDELRRRATDGFDEETFDGEGKLIRRVRRLASNDLLAELKRRDPSYRDSAQVQVATRVDVEVPVLPAPADAGLDMREIIRAGIKAGTHQVVVSGLIDAARNMGVLTPELLADLSTMVEQTEREHARGELVRRELTADEERKVDAAEGFVAHVVRPPEVSR